MSDCERLPDHLTYLSEMLANNATVLHVLLNDGQCGGIESFPCGDHFHIGHESAAKGAACKARVKVKQEEKGKKAWEHKQQKHQWQHRSSR